MGHGSNLLAEQVFGSPGYSTAVSLDRDELAFFLGEIDRQWLDRIESEAPEVVDRFRCPRTSRRYWFPRSREQ